MNFKKKLVKANEISRAIILPKVLLDDKGIEDDDTLLVYDEGKKIIIEKED